MKISVFFALPPEGASEECIAEHDAAVRVLKRVSSLELVSLHVPSNIRRADLYIYNVFHGLGVGGILEIRSAIGRGGPILLLQHVESFLPQDLEALIRGRKHVRAMHFSDLADEIAGCINDMIFETPILRAKRQQAQVQIAGVIRPSVA